MSYDKRCDCRDQMACEHPWWLRVKVKGGKRVRINLTEMFPDDDVTVAAAKARVLARQGKTIDRPIAATCRVVAAHYVAARGGRKHYYLDGFLAELGDRPIDEVSTAEVKALVKTWLTRKRCKRGVKAGAVAERHMKQTIRHFFNWAIEEGYATRTPFKLQGVNVIHVKATKGRNRRLEEGEETRILTAADPYIADFFRAIIETGCRPGELRSLQWTEVRSDEIVLLASKTKDREERRVPIMPVLRSILDRRRLGPDGTKLPDDSFVFGDDTGRMMSKKQLSERWIATLERAKITDLRLHDLRREAGSQLLEAGASVVEVRDALGHSNLSMTSRYLGLQKDGLKRAYQKRAVHRARQQMRRVK
jgi:integrase